MTATLLECANGTKFKFQSPIGDMYKHAVRYGFENKIMECVNNSIVCQIEPWKILVKKAVWKSEIFKSRASCMLYRNLDAYSSCVRNIEMHAWWSVLKARPCLKKHVASVMAALLGGQPSGLQCNFSGTICRICHLRERDDVVHILFICPALQITRQQNIMYVIREMPLAMKATLLNCNAKERANFFLSGLQCRYTCEWIRLYESIARWVYSMYKIRKSHYDSLDAE